MGNLLEARAEPRLEQFDVVAGRFAGGMEAAVRHHDRGRRIVEEALHREAPGVGGQGGGIQGGVDRRAQFALRQLSGDGEGTTGGVEHLGQLQLSRVQVEPAQQVGHHRGRQDANTEAVARPQPVGDRGAQVAGGKAQLVGNRLAGGVEIGKVVAPVEQQLGHGVDRPGLVGGRAGTERGVQPQQRLGHARQGCSDFGEFGAADRQPGQCRLVEHALELGRERVAVVAGQLAQIEVIGRGELEQERGGERPLVALDQIEIADRHAEVGCHAGLRHALGQAQAAQACTGEQLAVGGHAETGARCGTPTPTLSGLRLRRGGRGQNRRPPAPR